MSTDLVVPDQILDIRTGELVPAADIPRVADILRHLREYKDSILAAIKLCEAAIVEESRRTGTKTLHLDGAEVTITGGPRLSWDVSVLEELRDVGLPDERFADLVVIEQTYKVNAAVAKQIEAANPVYGEIVGRARSYVDGPLRVGVK